MVPLGSIYTALDSHKYGRGQYTLRNFYLLFEDFQYYIVFLFCFETPVGVELSCNGIKFISDFVYSHKVYFIL